MFSYNLTSEELFDLNKADERRAGGAKFLRLGLAGGGGLDWLGGPQILVKCLVMGATVKRVEGL